MYWDALNYGSWVLDLIWITAMLDLKCINYEGAINDYKKSMSSSTKSKSSRERRVKSILEYLSKSNINVKYTL